MRASTKKQLLAIAILATLNFLMSGLTLGDAESLDGHIIEAHSAESRRGAFSALFFGMQLLSLLVALPLAAIPYRGLPYGQRLVTFALAIALGLQGLFFVLGIAKIIGLWG